MRLIDALLCCVCCSVVEGPVGLFGEDQFYAVTVWFETEQETEGFRKPLNEVIIARQNDLYGEEKIQVIDALLSCVGCSVVEGPIGASYRYRIRVLFKTEQEAERFTKALHEVLLAQYNALYRKETLGRMQ